MAKPIINKITSVDALQDYVVTMTYNGNQPYSNQIIIYDGNTLEVVFNERIDSFLLKHTIPANTLVNGKKYAIQVQFFDVDGVASALSDKYYFWTLETPLFYFEGIKNEDVIKSASLEVNVHYSQSNWEDVKSYKFMIYDETKVLLSESDMLYYSGTISYVYRGLDNDTTYYIRCAGITDRGIELDTGYIKIFAKYENANMYSRIYSECNEYNGMVKYYTNLILIEPDEDNYEYEDGYINLLDKTITYSSNFLISGDFTMSIKCKDAYREATLLKCSNENSGFTLSSIFADDGSLMYKLVVPNGICNYVIYSNKVNIDVSDLVTIHIRRINNIYSITVFTEYGGSIREYNLWLGETRPVAVSNYDVWIDHGTGSIKVDKDNVTIFYQEEIPEDVTGHEIWIGGELS